MNGKLLLVGVLAVATWSVAASAGIPEPDVVLYGRVYIDGTQALATDTHVEIIGRVEVGDVEHDVGRYRMGDNFKAGDHYILRIRIESLADGSTQSDNAALIGQTVRVYIKNGEQSETFDGEFVLSDRGVVHVLDLGGGACIVVGAFPPNCAIDARQPSMPDGSAPDGWDRIELTVAGCPAASLGADDFSITVTSGTAPTVADVVASGDTVTVVFNRTIPDGAWTCVTLGTTAQCLASMPGDVNGDRTSAPSDILRVIDCLNGVALCDIWQCDLDRSNLCGPPDILRVIDLLNGAGVYEPWLNRSLPLCPSAP